MPFEFKLITDGQAHESITQYRRERLDAEMRGAIPKRWSNGAVREPRVVVQNYWDAKVLQFIDEHLELVRNRVDSPDGPYSLEEAEEDEIALLRLRTLVDEGEDRRVYG